MEVDHRMWGGLHPGEETHQIRHDAYPLRPGTTPEISMWCFTCWDWGSFITYHGWRLRKTHSIWITHPEQSRKELLQEALALVWGVKKFHLYLFGRYFTLVTDHTPLTSIFNPRKGVPAMTVARLFLTKFEYSIEYKNTTQHGNADGLSHLPLEETHDKETVDPVEIFLVSQMEVLPVSADMTPREIRFCHVWWNTPSKAGQRSTRRSWNHSTEGRMSAHHTRSFPDVRFTGVNLTKIQTQVLDELHEGHLGVAKMKALAEAMFGDQE